MQQEAATEQGKRPVVEAELESLRKQLADWRARVEALEQERYELVARRGADDVYNAKRVAAAEAEKMVRASLTTFPLGGEGRGTRADTARALFRAPTCRDSWSSRFGLCLVNPNGEPIISPDNPCCIVDYVRYFHRIGAAPVARSKYKTTPGISGGWNVLIMIRFHERCLVRIESFIGSAGH